MIKRMTWCVVLAAVLAPAMLRPEPPDAKRIEITAKRFSYDPGTVTLKKGEPVVLVLKSADVAHGLRFRELNVEVKAPKGGTSEVSFTPQKAGDFVGHCSVFCGAGHGSMALTLHVVE